MAYKSILVVSDNQPILNFFIELLERRSDLKEDRLFHFVCSPKNTGLAGKKIGNYTLESFDVKQNYAEILQKYDLVISAHCKQLFPEQLVEGVKCINIHPGLNPYNRGWYPQVFSILNGLPLGATIHEIDADIDHGNIIDQMEVPLYEWDTSLDAYARVFNAEKELMERSIATIVEGEYTITAPSKEGNINLKKDFNALREITMDEQVTYKEAIDRLRALTHGEFKNAYFYTKEGKKVFVSVNLILEES